jgi:alpha-glucosidase
MKNTLIKLLIITATIFQVSCGTENTKWSVFSPSGNLKFTVKQIELKALVYNVSFVKNNLEQSVIADSPLGLNRADASFTENLKFTGSEPVRIIDEKYTQPIGKIKVVSYKASEMTLNFENEIGKKIQIIVRASDDGVAFRYRFPETDSNLFSIVNELTGFAISGEGKTWLQPYDKVTMYSPGYERYFENGIPIGTSAPGREGWCFPALFETDSSWLLITEAALDSTWFGAHLQPEASGGLYNIRMPEKDEARNVCTNIPYSTLPWASPWRVIQIAEDLAGIVESELVGSLNPTSRIQDESWIKPGRASWSWWSDWPSPKNYQSLIRFMDMASEMGWEYSLVDANWDLMTGGNIEELIKYAYSKNVGIMMWYNSGGKHNDVTERPRNIIIDPVKRKEEFQKLTSWGVKGIKIDFFQSDKPEIIKLYLDILKDAADNKLLVNFHGCTIPRGWSRTWPNLVSMEAVRGAESYAFDEKYPDMATWHNTILPFTRNVVGSMDYTPVTFSNQRYPHITTWGHELALSVVFESGILHLAGDCNSYLSLPIAPKNFLKNVPVTWDQTVFLAGYPGKQCVIARKSVNVWYIGGINGTGEKLSWEINLSRLGNQDFTAVITTDGATGSEFASTEASQKAGDKLKVEVLPFGGFVAILK